MTTRWRTYVEACTDPHLFAPWFSGDTWAAWRVIDKGIFGLPFVGSEPQVFEQLTGRTDQPTSLATEVWLAFGRRGGKDVKAASYVTWLGTFGADQYGYRKRLTRGERGVVQLLAVDRDQAQVCFGYVKAMFEQPMLVKLVERITSDSIELKNQISIEITTNDKRRVRGRTVVAAVFDEVAHWKSDSTVNPDKEVYEAIMPSMATIPNSLLIGISSPYSRRGLLWEKHQRHWGEPGSILVARAPTWVMNPTLARDGEFISGQFKRDSAWASGEYGAEWRADIEAFVSLDAVEACIEEDMRERLPDRRTGYVAFIDPSGGSNDSFTCAIAHREGKTPILDCIREIRPPFSPEQAVEELADLMRKYRVSRARSDKFGGVWVVDAFRRAGIHIEQSAKPKTDLYADLLPLINSAACDLLDNDKMISQLVGLERRDTRSGKRSIDHSPGGHDDVANAVAGAILYAFEKIGSNPFQSSASPQTRAIMGASDRWWKRA